jgi:hypothetical protein
MQDVEEIPVVVDPGTEPQTPAQEAPAAPGPDAPAPAAPAAAVKGVGLFARLTVAEPVRLWLYSVLSAVMALLVLYGVLTGEQVAVWAGLAAAVLGVPVTEGLRASVYSPRKFAGLRAHADTLHAAYVREVTR